MILFALLSSFGLAVSGLFLTYLYDNRATFGARLAAGYVIGSTLAGFLGYALLATGDMSLRESTLFANSVLPFLSAVALIMAGRAEDLKRDLRSLLRPSLRFRKRRLAYGLGFVLLAAFFAYLFRGTMYIRDGAIWTDNHNNFGDLPWHLAIVQGFVLGHNIPPQHPEFAGIRLTYPFLVDWNVAQIMQTGASLSGAILLQNILLSLSLTALLMRWVIVFTRRVGAALILPWLFVFSGGFGFTLAWQDWRSSGQSILAFLAAIPHDYTTDSTRGMRWGNTMTALLTTQRGLMLAIPLALIVWTIWWQVLQHRRTDPIPYRRLIAAGLITGMLPLVHGHTFLMLFIVGGPLALGDIWRAPARFKPWALCFLLALLLTVPQALLLASSSGSQGSKFFGWQPGWDKGDEAPLSFWWRNLGLFFPLLILALLWKPGRAGSVVPPRLLRYYAPFTLCFIIPNLFRLAPWVWDNIKVLLYWHLASALLISALLAQIWQRRRHMGFAPTVARRALVLALIFLLTLSGALDVLRIARGEGRWGGVYEADAVAFANAITKVTAPGDVILCAPQFNAPPLLAGRHELMGYEGHLWSHGLDFAARKEDVQKLFAGAPETTALLAKYHVRWVEIGPLEREMSDYPLNESYWGRYPIAAHVGPWTLYDVRNEAEQ